MKNAEDYRLDINRAETNAICAHQNVGEAKRSVIKQIKLDAFKAGMRKAAEIVRDQKETAFQGTLSMNQYGSGVKQGLSEAVTTILTAADNLKELP